ncbi:hypothetical protein D3C75_1327700 [compost metagenome]
MKHPGLALRNGGNCLFDHQAFDHATTDSANTVTIGHHQHLPRMARCRATAFDNLGERKGPVFFF